MKIVIPCPQISNEGSFITVSNISNHVKAHEGFPMFGLSVHDKDGGVRYLDLNEDEMKELKLAINAVLDARFFNIKRVTDERA